jgi:N-acetylglutamate synthase-like GNAT family acetyltransferase
MHAEPIMGANVPSEAVHGQAYFYMKGNELQLAEARIICWEMEGSMIRKGTHEDFEEIFAIINDAAIAYKGVIPSDQWHEPYMTREELQEQIEDGVRFSCYVDDNELVGVMGIQDKADVELIRHAYVRTKQRNKGIGTLLLHELVTAAKKPILIGTWKAARWAIRFYEKHGFRLVEEEEKNRLLKKYWALPDRQVETSVVLTGGRYKG